MLPKQIVFLTPGFAENESDTSCIPALQDFVLGWKEFHAEIKLKVIAFQYPFEEKNYHWHGVEVYAAGGANRKGIARQLTWRRVRRKLGEWCNEGTVLISYFLTEATLVAQKFARKNQLPHIALAAGQDVRKQNRYLQTLNLQSMKVICFNKKMNDSLYSSSLKNCDYIIPIGIPATMVAVNPKQERITDLLIVASLIPLKQLTASLKVMTVVKEMFPQVSCVVIGEGPERKSLEHFSLHAGIKNNVTFNGGMKREDVIHHMKQSKILLHTSSYEGQSTVISEALACGMSVVCFDVGRICDHEKIFVCRNEGDMISVIKKLLAQNQFDFTPVIPVTMKETIEQYSQVIQSF